MYNYKIDTADKASLYKDLYTACEAITMGEDDAIANMANVAALLWQYIPDLNWAGFYRMKNNALILGPFQGKAACIHIPLDRGVCGKAASSGEIQCIKNVHEFEGHIACDAESVAELVAPIFNGEGKITAVIDLDSPIANRFDDQDVEGISHIAALLSERISESIS